MQALLIVERKVSISTSVENFKLLLDYFESRLSRRPPWMFVSPPGGIGFPAVM